MRSDYCGSIHRAHLQQTITVFGWVHRRRDHGGVIFIDLRDREGLLQIVCDPDNAATFKTAETLRNEFVVRVTGKVRQRPEGTVNPNLVSGEDRSAGRRDRDPEPVADAAVHDGRRPDFGKHPARIPLSRSAAAADAEEPAVAPPRRDVGARIPRPPRLHRHRNADALQVDARGRARVSGAVAHPRRPFLRAAAIAAAVQAAADDRRASTAITRSSSASATKTCAPTASRNSRRSTSKRRF